jgi:hypothetical protein
MVVVVAFGCDCGFGCSMLCGCVVVDGGGGDPLATFPTQVHEATQ